LQITTIRLVFFKEFLEALRDYRTVVPMVFMSLAMGPLVTLAMPKIALSQAKAIITDHYKVAIVGNSHLISSEIIKNHLLTLTEIGAMPAQAAVDKGTVDAAIVTPPDFDQVTEHSFGTAQKIDIIYNGTRAKSSLARLFLATWTDGLNHIILEKRIKLLGIGLRAPPYINTREITPETLFGVASPFLQVILTCILMMMALLGVIYPALDAITGERERQTLEPLLMTQAERGELFAGKLLTVATTSYISVLLTLAGFFVAQFFQARVLGLTGFLEDSFPMKAIFPWPCFLMTALVMLPLCITLAAAALMFASYAKTIQQGQGYFLPLMLVALIPLPVVMVGSIHLNASVSAMPFLNAVVAFNDILCGYVNFGWLSLTALVSVAFCFLVVQLVSPLLAREDLLFGVEDSPARRFAAGDYRRELFFLFVLVFLLMFYGSQVLVLNYHLWGVALTQILVVLLPALIFVHYWLKLPLSAVINLSVPRGGLATMACTVLMAPMTIAVSALCVLLESKILPGTETLNKIMAKVLGIGDEPLLILIFIIGVLPGICEELFFRGVVLSLLPRRFSQAKLVAVVGTLFGAFHMSILRFLPTAVMGALLTFVRLRAGSLWPAMLLHCLHNSLSVVMTRNMPGDPAPWMFAAGITSGLLGFWLFMRVTALPSAPPSAPPDALPSAPPDAPPDALPSAPPDAPPDALPSAPPDAPPDAPQSADPHGQ
jgi:sodium transport system permease protein